MNATKITDRYKWSRVIILCWCFHVSLSCAIIYTLSGRASCVTVSTCYCISVQVKLGCSIIVLKLTYSYMYLCTPDVFTSWLKLVYPAGPHYHNTGMYNVSRRSELWSLGRSHFSPNFASATIMLRNHVGLLIECGREKWRHTDMVWWWWWISEVELVLNTCRGMSDRVRVGECQT